MSPATQSKFAKVRSISSNAAIITHRSEKPHRCEIILHPMLIENLRQIITLGDNYLWKLDRERVLEGKLIINRDDNDTWKVTGTAIAVKATKSIK